MKRALPSILLPFIAVLWFAGFPTARAEVDFSRDVRPILASNCLKCHGVDDNARKGNLRLDVRESAIHAAKSGDVPIVPGKPEHSALIRHIFSSDPDEVMPPPATKIVLSDEDKKTLRTWISQGAPYAAHWAFVAPKPPALPAVKDGGWCRNGVDRFILARLEKEGLRPSDVADKYTLCRRVYLDLIGLPPTPPEADAFVNDPSPDAYEKLVDRLLAMPQYGERWARRWLDLARYADTNGYEKDRPRSIWPYRDWVINALNADMPFDQFTIEQIAGDMLPHATIEQKIATGFHRNTMRNEEGGTDPLEYRYYSMVDRVSTTGTAWLGLTIGCAQCHSHKYDPITNKDYYQFMALLNNATEPELKIPNPEVLTRQKQINTEIAKLTAELPEKFPAPTNVKWETLKGTAITASGVPADARPDGSWTFGGNAPDRDTYSFIFETGDADFDRIRLEALKEGKDGPGRTPHGNFVLSEITVELTPPDAGAASQVVKFARAEADYSQPDYPVASAIDGNIHTGWAIDEAGKKAKSRTATFLLDKPMHVAAGTKWKIVLDQQYGEKHVLGRLRLSYGAPLHDDRPVAQRRADALRESFAAWEKRASAHAVQWTVLRPAELKSSEPILTLLGDDSVLASGDITKSDTYDLTFHTDLKGITAIRVEALPDDSLPHHGPGMVYYEGEPGDFSLSEIGLSAGGKEARFAKATQDFFGGGSAAAAIDGNPQTGWNISGGQGQPHFAVFSLAEPTGDAKELKIHMLFERYYASALGRFRIAVTTDPKAADPEAVPPEVEAALATPSDDRRDAQRNSIFDYYLEVAPELQEARDQIKRLRDSIPEPPTTLVMQERSPEHRRPTFVHHRGGFLTIEEEVDAGVPSFLPPLPAGEPANRLALAKWLVSPANPLTARVAVNRQWQALFGRGIVGTLGDFGYQGDLPTHPELLDYLAVQFMHPTDPATGDHARDWSLKAIDRLIVTSAAYRQSSRQTPALLAADPQNLLISRGPRFRVEAEVLRDSALRESGLLSAKIGGPSVFPPQPPSVTTEGAYGPMAWNVSAGEDRYRRSLYTFAKRSAPFALYANFDAPSGEVCTARREVSNSALQALSLLNDQVFEEAAQRLGQTIAAMQGDDSSRAIDVFRRCLTRPPAAEEVSALVNFAQAQRARFAAKVLDPNVIAGKGEGNKGEANVVERATWTVVARAILNLDEAMTKD